MPPRDALGLVAALAACASPVAPRLDGATREASADLGPDVTLPDLTAAVRFPLVQERVFAAGACDVIEGCTLPGLRRLLRFDLSTPNTGDGDLELGAPTVEGRVQPGFEWGECHGHPHFAGYADYRLVTLDGRPVGRGHKQSFCLEDTERVSAVGSALPDAERYTCGRQGIHAGWMDVYPRGLDCQYIDVTDVPAGRYRIRATVNPERRIAEARYDNNVGELDVDLPAWDRDAGVDAGADAATVDPTLPCASSEQGPRRECGWEAERDPRRCEPGATVTAGCDALCGEPLGTCLGDTMIRVCDAVGACDDRAALASNDDACVTDGARARCSRVTFTCPASGAYRVLTGAYRAGSAYTCRVATR